MRRWLRRWAGLRPWRRRRHPVDAEVRSRLLAASIDPASAGDEDRLGGLVAAELPRVSQALVRYVADDGRTLVVRLRRGPGRAPASCARPHR